MEEPANVTKLAEVSRRLDRIEQLLTDQAVALDLAVNRTLPATIAHLSNTISGVTVFQADLAGTSAKLALEIASHVDRLNLLEKMSD